MLYISLFRFLGFPAYEHASLACIDEQDFTPRTHKGKCVSQPNAVERWGEEFAGAVEGNGKVKNQQRRNSWQWAINLHDCTLTYHRPERENLKICVANGGGIIQLETLIAVTDVH